MNYLDQAKEIDDQIIQHRRYFHENAELGYDLPLTIAYIVKELESYGYKPKVVENSGVVATVGVGDRCVLLRADMDALPIREESGEEFSAINGNMHACGHDTHAAMLLGAAKLLKANEDKLEGCVKLLFQPAEELLTGCKTMVDAGVLENPRVDVAIAGHISSLYEPGVYIKEGIAMSSANNFRIIIKGYGSHGAMPSTGIDPINIGAHILINTQTILARELDIDKQITLTMGKFIGDGAMNTIPEECLIEGTLRTFDNNSRIHAVKRLEEITLETAKMFRGQATIEFLCDVPVLINDNVVASDLIRYTEEFLGDGEVGTAEVLHATEDFAHISQKVPSSHFWIGAPHPELGTSIGHHNSRVRFNESQFYIGSAVYAQFAYRWLEENK